MRCRPAPTRCRTYSGPARCSGTIVRADIGAVLAQRGSRGERVHDVMLQFITSEPVDNARFIELSVHGQTTYYSDLKTEIQYFRPWVQPREFAGLIHIAVPENQLDAAVALASDTSMCTSPETSLAAIARFPLIAQLPSKSLQPPYISFATPEFRPQRAQFRQEPQLQKSAQQPFIANLRSELRDRRAPTRDASGKCSIADHPARILKSAFPNMSAVSDTAQHTGSGNVEVTLDAAGDQTSRRILKSTNDSLLDRIMLQTAEETVFEPVVRDCKSMPGEYIFRVEFEEQ